MRYLRIARQVGACLSQLMKAGFYLVKIWMLFDPAP
jgi:hypothetical protein